MAENALLAYIQELNKEIAAAQQGKTSLPYRHGTFMVLALADDIEIEIKDISEEDAILIEDDLRAEGVKAQLYASLICPHCHLRVAKQSYCMNCRQPLS